MHQVGSPLMPVLLPDFLVVGAQKSGTTWLDAVLRTHHQVYMPSLRKEVHFFDSNFEKGPEWYTRYFSDARGSHLRIGEATPMYLFDPQVPRRISDTIPHAQIVAIFRNPKDRAVSHYRHAQARWGFSGTFTEFVAEDNTVIARGMYSEQLQRYKELWPPDAILTCIFEEVTNNYDLLVQQLGSFLKIDETAFGEPPTNTAATQRPNKAGTRRLATRITDIQSPHLDRLVGFARSVRGSRSFAGTDFIEATDEELTKLNDVYVEEIPRFEKLLGIDLSVWRNT